MVDCISWATKEQGVPVRQHGLVHTGSQSKGSIWSHMTHTQAFQSITVVAMAIKSEVIPPLEEWDINLEVSSRVY